MALESKNIEAEVQEAVHLAKFGSSSDCLRLPNITIDDPEINSAARNTARPRCKAASSRPEAAGPRPFRHEVAHFWPR